MSRGREILTLRKGGPSIGPPPAHLTAEQLTAWRGIVSACPDVRRSDGLCVEMAARSLAQWRSGRRTTALLRLLARTLGKLLIARPNRRRLIFGEWRDG